MSTKNSKILYAIYNNPLLIGSLLKDTSISKGMIYRELYKAIPCRIGIEFELSGDFRKGFINKYHKGTIDKYSNLSRNLRPNDLAMDYVTPVADYSKPIKKGDINEIMTKFYGVYEIKGDTHRNVTDEDLYEIRVSIKDYHQLKGLYKFMQDLPEFCKLHEGGGIHIHVDISEYYPIDPIFGKMRSYMQHNLQEVVNIFPKYKGKYNRRRVDMCKGSYINISGKKSFEYRIAPLSFDYNTVITWVIKCIKFRNKVIHYCKLKKHPVFTKVESTCKVARTEVLSDYINTSEGTYSTRIYTNAVEGPVEDISFTTNVGTTRAAW